MSFYTLIFWGTLAGVSSFSFPVGAQSARLEGTVGITIIGADNTARLDPLSALASASLGPAPNNIKNTESHLVRSPKYNNRGEAEGVLITLMY